MNSLKISVLAALGLVCWIEEGLAEEGAGQVETVIVTGARKADASKASVPLMETPQNIQVLSSELLLDQGDHLLDEALRNVAGVMPGGYYTGWDYFRIRGFDASGFIYQDGLLYDSIVSTNAELFGLEQVEVVKGPSSSLYGQGAPGGLVNLVSKRPVPETFLKASAGYGSFDSYQFTLDGGTTLSDTVEGRVVGVARRDGTFTDYAAGDTRFYFAPSLHWQVDGDTELTVLGAVQNDHLSTGFPLPAEGTVFKSKYGYIPLSRFNGEPGRSNQLDETRVRLGYELRHRVNDVLTLRQNFRYSYADTTWDKMLYPAFVDDSDEAGSIVEYRYPFGLESDWYNVGVDTSAEARFDTGAIEHSFIAGIDFYTYRYNSHWLEMDYGTGPYMPLDLIHPVYGGPITPYRYDTHNLERVRTLGLYMQEHARWDRFTLTAGLRWDDAFDENFRNGAPLNDQEKYQLVPRVGLTYDVTDGVTAYGSYSQSFRPQLGYVGATGDALDPETGQQWEGGFKFDLLDGRLNATAAVYQLTRQHVAVADATGLFYFQTGEQRSTGFELDSQMVIGKGWEMIASYAYTDATVTKDRNADMVGDGALNVPRHSFSLWSKYGIEDGFLQGLAFSAGINAYSDQWGDLPNTFKLPAYVLVGRKHRVQLGQFLRPSQFQEHHERALLRRLLQRVVREPRRAPRRAVQRDVEALRFRSLLVKVHRYAGLSMAVFLFVAGITGTVIAFSPELDAWLNPDLLVVASRGEPLPPSTLVSKVERALPGATVSYLPLDSKPGEAAVVSISGKDFDQVFVDPVTGTILGHRLWGQCCFARERVIPFLYLTHYSLSMPGSWGLLLMGIVSLIWALDCFVGFTLTLPRGDPFWPKWRPSWWVKTGVSAHRLNVDMHRAAGLWLWIVLFVVALTGVGLNLPEQVMRPLVSLFSPLKPDALTLAAPRFTEHPKPAALGYDAAIARARAEANRPFQPVGVIHYENYNAYGVGFTAPGMNGRDGMGSSWIYIDDRTGKVLSADMVGQGSAGDVFMQAQYPLHSGRILGLAGRILVSITGLAVAMLSVTGVLIWLKKRAAAKVHKQRLRARELLQDHASGRIAGAEGA